VPTSRTWAGTSRTRHPTALGQQQSCTAGTAPPPGPSGDPLLSLYLLGSSDGRKSNIGGGGSLKRLRRYSNNGYGSGNGNGRTARRQVGWQRHVNNDDFPDGNKGYNQQEIKQRREDGILLTAAMLLRAQVNWWRTTTNGYQQWQCGASKDDDVEDNDIRTGGLELSMIDKDDQAERAASCDDIRIGSTTGTTMFIVNA
jgi:hypothetical protein